MTVFERKCMQMTKFNIGNNYVSVFPGDRRNLKVREDSERDCDYLEISLLVNYLKANNSQRIVSTKKMNGIP